MALPDLLNAVFVAETGPERLSVKMGTLTQLEFDALRTRHEDFVEATARELLDRFGEGFFERNNDRLREELEIVRFGYVRERPERYSQTWRRSRRRF